MENYNYLELINYYSSKLVSENRLSICDRIISNKIMYSIQFLQPEWFLDLDDDLRYNIIVYLQSNYINILKNNIPDYSDYIYNDKNHNYKKRTYSDMLQTSEN
jgi:hypothetical protein